MAQPKSARSTPRPASKKTAAAPKVQRGKSKPEAHTPKRATGPKRAIESAAPPAKARALKPTKSGAAKAATSAQRQKPAPAHVEAITQRLTQAIPEALCELHFDSPFQLVIATILSAQSTDKAVNAVTPVLFQRFPTPAALAASDPDEVETIIKRTGFFRAKTKSIRGAAQLLVDEFGGEVPRTLEELIRLPGVARKTSNVVLGTAYGIASGFVVDTHVSRVSQHLGLTEETDPVKIEQDLCAQFPRERWVDMGHRVLLHGRYTCLARRPMCEVCPLNELCPTRLTAETEGKWQELAEREAERVRAGMAG
jgi:endonuclease-3